MRLVRDIDKLLPFSFLASFCTPFYSHSIARDVFEIFHTNKHTRAHVREAEHAIEEDQNGISLLFC